MVETEKIKKFVSFTDGAESVALLCHVNPDSDTLGSALSLRLAFKKLGCRADVYCEDNPPPRLSFLPTIDAVNECADDKFKKYDLVIAVDCNDLERFGTAGKYFKHASRTLSADHHKTNRNFADYSICDPLAGATAEIVFKIVCELSVKAGHDLIDNDIATLLFSALVGDTGAFSFDNTTDETFAVAGKLLHYGVDSHNIIYKMIKSQPANRYKLKARAMCNTRFFDGNEIAVMTFFKKDFTETETSTAFTDGIINELIDVDSVKIAFAVSEVGEKYYKASIRTKAPYDAASVATVFGGGGHSRAAGCRISGFYEDVVDKLLKAARDELNA